MPHIVAYTLVGAVALAGYVLVKRQLANALAAAPVPARIKSYRLERGVDGVYRPVETRS